MRAWLVALMVISLALAGCGDKEKAGPGGVPYETPEKEGNVYVIKLTSSNKFDPVNAKVAAGSTVEWQIENSGCVLQGDHPTLDSRKHPPVGEAGVANGNLDNGSKWRWSADQAGTYAYECSGKDITGTIKVT